MQAVPSAPEPGLPATQAVVATGLVDWPRTWAQRKLPGQSPLEQHMSAHWLPMQIQDWHSVGPLQKEPVCAGGRPVMSAHSSNMTPEAVSSYQTQASPEQSPESQQVREQDSVGEAVGQPGKG